MTVLILFLFFNGNVYFTQIPGFSDYAACAKQGERWSHMESPEKQYFCAEVE